MAKEKYKNALTGAFNQFITPGGDDVNSIDTTPARNMKTRERVMPPIVLGAYKAKRDTENPRHKRVQLLFRPNVHAELLMIAQSQGRSVNNLIEEILTDYLAKNRN